MEIMYKGPEEHFPLFIGELMMKEWA